MGAAMSYRTVDGNLALDAKDCRRISDALADALCWFAGFKAAAKEDVDLPPGIDKLRAFNNQLKDYFQ
jgi:hypothetical protein